MELSINQAVDLLKKKGFTVTLEKWILPSGTQSQLKLDFSYKQTTIHVLGKNAQNIRIPKKLLENMPKFKGGILTLKLTTSQKWGVFLQLGDKHIPLNSAALKDLLTIIQAIHSPKQAKKLVPLAEVLGNTLLVKILTLLGENTTGFCSLVEENVLLLEKEDTKVGLHLESSRELVEVLESHLKTLFDTTPQLEKLILVFNASLSPVGVVVTPFDVYLSKGAPAKKINVSLLKECLDILKERVQTRDLPIVEEVISFWSKQIF